MAMVFAEAAVATLLGVWLALTLAIHWPRFRTRLRHWDFLALIPEWNFFAPTPGQGDFHLLFRDELTDGALTDWEEVSLPDSRALHTALWNPKKRTRKALFDCAQELSVHLRDLADTNPQASIPYLTLLQYVSCRERLPGAVRTQFLLMYSEGMLSDAEPVIVHLSLWHGL
jgi:hypothetical protein